MRSDNRCLWCVHGNLQQPSVWGIFTDRFFDLASSNSKPALPLPLRSVNLWESRAKGLQSWAEEFCDDVGSKRRSPQLLMGYSLGGRLAFHTILHRPSLWQGAVIISADTGLISNRERQERLRLDQEWGRRFRSESWQKLLWEWDAQSVFAGRPCPEQRIESAFSRHAIEQRFDQFSKGRQEDLTPLLAELDQPPILFVSGEEDPKYCRIGRALSVVCPTIEHVTIPDAAHRVPWDNPEDFKNAVQSFINRIAP